MKRKIIVSVALAGTMLGLGASPALADEIPPSPAFGQHLAEMTPQHALENGAMFGDCVSTMATGAVCTHG